MWYIYILISLEDKRTYTGSTNDVQKRLKEHNNGYVKATKNRRPLKLIYKEEFKNQLEARKREKYLKSCAGRKYIKTKVFNK